MKKLMLLGLVSVMLSSCDFEPHGVPVYSINHWYNQDDISFNLSSYVEDGYLVYSQKYKEHGGKQTCYIGFSSYQDEDSGELIEFTNDDYVVYLERGSMLTPDEFSHYLFYGDFKFKIVFVDLSEEKKSLLLRWENQHIQGFQVSINDYNFFMVDASNASEEKVVW